MGGASWPKCPLALSTTEICNKKIACIKNTDIYIHNLIHLQYIIFQKIDRKLTLLSQHGEKILCKNSTRGLIKTFKNLKNLFLILSFSEIYEKKRSSHFNAQHIHRRSKSWMSLSSVKSLKSKFNILLLKFNFKD